MSARTKSSLTAPQGIDPSAPSKGAHALSPHLELSHTSPLINGLRQSRIAFRVQRTKANSWFIASNNENIAPASHVESKRSPDATVLVPKSCRDSSGRRVKQTLLTEKSQPAESSRQSTKNVQGSIKLTRTRRTVTRRSVSVSEPLSASEERQQDQEPKACSLSPQKQFRAKSPVLEVKTAPIRLQQTQLTNFGIRRTARQFAKAMQVTRTITEQKEAEVIAAILRSEESGLKVVVTEEKGRGVITTRTFSPGEFVVEYIGELITGSEARAREAEYNKNPSVGSFMFFFSHGNQRYCVDATKETGKLGRLINHSRLHPNCVVKVIPINGIPRLALFAKTEIPPGEELLYDYGDRGKASLIAHPWLKT